MAESLTLHIHLHNRFSIQVFYMRIVRLFMSKKNSNYPIVQFVFFDGVTDDLATIVVDYLTA